MTNSDFAAAENVVKLRREYDKAPEHLKEEKAKMWLDAERELSDPDYIQYIRLWQKGNGHG
jgi:hypothetical protein